MPDQPARVGLDPVERVFLMENHDQAFRVWRDAGSANKILIHIDAHHDMWWAADLESLTIASFIAGTEGQHGARVFLGRSDATGDRRRDRERP